MTDKAVVRARAPLRLGLAGGGTDVSPYCDIYSGIILNATISWYAYATISPAPPGRVIFRAADLQQEIELDADPDLPLEGPLALHRGVYRRIVREYNHGRPLNLCLTTYSDVAAGSGLGSSSTVVVAMIEAMKELLLLPLGEYEVARIAYKIEREDLNLKGGKQDQYAATFGGVNLMEFRDKGQVIVNPLRIRSSTLAEFEASLVLYFTGVSRDSEKIIDDQSNLIRDKRNDSIEAMHALKNDAVDMKEYLLSGDIKKVAEVLGRSWISKKRTSTHVATPLIDRVHDLAIENGAYAGKVSGAGGGGFMMFIVNPVYRPQVIRALSTAGGQVMTCHFTKNGSTAWRVAGREVENEFWTHKAVVPAVGA